MSDITILAVVTTQVDDTTVATVDYTERERAFLWFTKETPYTVQVFTTYGYWKHLRTGKEVSPKLQCAINDYIRDQERADEASKVREALLQKRATPADPQPITARELTQRMADVLTTMVNLYDERATFSQAAATVEQARELLDLVEVRGI